MRIVILVSIAVFFSADSLAQKKLVPVSQSSVTGITLPAGSKKDNRMISISAARMMLDMESNKANTTLSDPEVLALTPFVQNGYNIDSLNKNLSATGWQAAGITENKEYSWFHKGNRKVVCYFSMDSKETSLYFAEATSLPVKESPVNKPLNSQLSTSASDGTPLAIEQATAGGNENNIGNSPILGTWVMTSSDQSSFRVNNGVMNYISRQYTFNANGTYTFVSKAFDPLIDNILLGKENGTFQVNGSDLTIIPLKSVLEAWSKKSGIDSWGSMLTTQNVVPEKVTYRITKQYFSGIKAWSVVLQHDKPTRRDGPYSGSSAFTNAWIYGTPCSECYIKLPGEK